MNVLVWSSPAPSAQPPRSNPFLRSSSVVPPLPCITPSTVTWVMVVSFMIEFPPPWAALVGGRSPLLRTPPPRSDSAARISFQNCPVRLADGLTNLRLLDRRGFG